MNEKEITRAVKPDKREMHGKFDRGYTLTEGGDAYDRNIASIVKASANVAHGVSNILHNATGN